MSSLFIYSCSNCDYSVDSWDSIIYVTKDNGERVICGHPGEYVSASKILIQDGHPLGGLSPDVFDIGSIFDGGDMEAYNKVQYGLTREETLFVRSRTGSMSVCICLECLNKSRLDIEKDVRLCGQCGSKQIKTVLELVGQTCPKCHSGIIEKKDSGFMS